MARNNNGGITFVNGLVRLENVEGYDGYDIDEISSSSIGDLLGLTGDETAKVKSTSRGSFKEVDGSTSISNGSTVMFTRSSGTKG